MLLIIGGSQDRDIHRLAHAAEWRQHPFRLILTDAAPPPVIYWQPGEKQITINGETFADAGTSVFFRYDVFSEKGAGADISNRNAGWFDAIKGWVETCPDVTIVNRRNGLDMNKPRALVWAKEAGMPVPRTWLTNDFSSFTERADYIAKPVGGGDYTRLLSEVEGNDRPWIVQEKLSYPEVRIFRAGEHFYAFSIASEILDYRTDEDFSMQEITPPEHLVQALQKLTDRIGLDYAAADFKTCPKTGQLLFLEVNTMPMFAGYDTVAKGRLSDAIFLLLTEREEASDPAQGAIANSDIMYNIQL